MQPVPVEPTGVCHDVRIVVTVVFRLKCSFIL
jgi:hypothetical protein